MNLPKAPEHQIRWGVVDPNCETAMKNWIKSIIDMVASDKISSEEAAMEIFEEIRELGYSEGYEALTVD